MERLIGKVKNGNYTKAIFDNGTVIKYNDLDNLTPDYPDSMDVKITNKCDMGCNFCHEDSKPDGVHGDIMNAKVMESLLPYTELAIGGGNPLEHPDLDAFLEKCKKLKLIPSMTVNQKHFMQDYARIKKLADDKLIYGIGVSLTSPDEENFIERVQSLPNAVIHVINGIHTIDTMKKLYDKNLKLLVLGYKEFRRGKNLYETITNKIDKDKEDWYNELPELSNHFNTVSFDNLALKQLNCKRLVSDEEWNESYLGEDGSHTMYLDLVKKTYSTSSTTPIEERKALLNDIKPMFEDIRQNRKDA